MRIEGVPGECVLVSRAFSPIGRQSAERKKLVPNLSRQSSWFFVRESMR